MVATKYNIKVTEQTKKDLDKLKKYPRETYEDILRKLIENGI